MHYSNYIRRRDGLIRGFNNSLDHTAFEDMNGQFSLVSASLVNFLPDIDFALHRNIYKNILLHKKLSILEQESLTILDYVVTENLDGEILPLLKSKPSIICTFHTGSYRVLNLLLMRHKIPFTLVMGKNVTEKEGVYFTNVYDNLVNKNETGNLNIIDAENARAGIQMLRALKQGRCLVLYIDGNSGSGETTAANQNSCIINFLNQQLYARKGIAYLAHLADVPVVTVAGYRKTWDEIRLRFFDPIYPDLYKDRNEFACNVTQQIYDFAAPLIKSYPEQWEAWLYLHKVAHIINKEDGLPRSFASDSKEDRVCFNSRLFGIFKLYSISFLLEKNTYSFYEIDNKLYDLLTGCINSPIKRGCFERSQFNELYEKGVLLAI